VPIRLLPLSGDVQVCLSLTVDRLLGPIRLLELVVVDADRDEAVGDEVEDVNELVADALAVDEGLGM
jgi:hypothetical protein